MFICTVLLSSSCETKIHHFFVPSIGSASHCLYVLSKKAIVSDSLDFSIIATMPFSRSYLMHKWNDSRMWNMCCCFLVKRKWIEQERLPKKRKSKSKKYMIYLQRVQNHCAIVILYEKYVLWYTYFWCFVDCVFPVCIFLKFCKLGILTNLFPMPDLIKNFILTKK